MKKSMNPEIEKARDKRFSNKHDGMNGLFFFKHKGTTLKVIASDGMGWDHVSVSIGHRCPTWEEMCFIKDLFFESDEVVMQLHPAKSDYINNHPNCLHLWKPQDVQIPQPDSILVGLRQ